MKLSFVMRGSTNHLCSKIKGRGVKTVSPFYNLQITCHIFKGRTGALVVVLGLQYAGWHCLAPLTVRDAPLNGEALRTFTKTLRGTLRVLHDSRHRLKDRKAGGVMPTAEPARRSQMHNERLCDCVAYQIMSMSRRRCCRQDLQC